MVSTGLHVIGQIKVRFPEVEFLGSTSKYKKRTKNRCLRPYNMSHWNVSRFRRAVRNEQKAWCTCKIVLLEIKPIASFTSPLPSALWLLKFTSIRQRLYYLRFFSCHVRRKDLPQGVVVCIAWWLLMDRIRIVLRRRQMHSWDPSEWQMKLWYVQHKQCIINVNPSLAFLSLPSGPE